MKDYSVNLEERKDFIRKYNVSKTGQIIVKYAKDKPWPLPYNNKNKNIIINKMTSQVKEAPLHKKRLIRENKRTRKFAIGCAAISVLTAIFGILGTSNLSAFSLFVSPIVAVTGLGLVFNIVKNNLIIKDIEKNIKFLKIEKKLNTNVRKNEKKDCNVLTNVSNKTKDAVKNFPENMPIFDINSFNYVPFRDVEQMMENIERNEKFGFDYTTTEVQSKGKTRKRTRK